MRVAELFGVLDVGRLRAGDALDVGLVELHRDAEGDGRDQRRLVRGIDAFDVEGRVGFGVARRCASFSTVSKDRPLSRISERMKLVVPLMMPAAHSMRLAVGPSRSALMIGMPPATAASNATMTPFCCGGEDFGAMHGEQRLVGGDDMLAVGDRLHHHFLGDTIAADQLDDDFDIGVVDDTEKVVGHLQAPPVTCFASSTFLSATTVIWIGRPARRVISSALRLRTVQVPPPTVPMPMRAYIDGFHLSITFLKQNGEHASPHENRICAPRPAVRRNRARSHRNPAAAPSPAASRPASCRNPGALRRVGHEIIDVEASPLVGVLDQPPQRDGPDILTFSHRCHAAAVGKDHPQPRGVVCRQIRTQLPMHAFGARQPSGAATSPPAP